MSDYREEALSAIVALVMGGDTSLTDDDLNILIRNPGEAKEYSKRLSEIYNAMFYGFFRCAAEGFLLVPENRVTEKFGHSIKDTYPEANEVFLKFAKTYWTLRVLTYDLMENDMEWIGAHLLGKLEQYIGPVFFPFPGPEKIAPSVREKTQRELIKDSGAKIDIEEFIKGNPILIRDRAAELMRKTYWAGLRNIFIFGLILTAIWVLLGWFVPAGWPMVIVNIVCLLLSLGFGMTMLWHLKLVLPLWLSALVSALLWILLFGLIRGLF